MDQTLPGVLVTRRMPSSVLAPLEAVCAVDRHDSTDPLPHDALCERLSGKQGLICMFDDRIDEAVLAAGDRLKVVATVAVGFDNIDVASAAAHGIVVANTPDIVTEMTWALILSVSRRLGEGDRTIRAGGLARLDVRFPAGVRTARQAARHCGGGAHRPCGGRHRPRVRHAGGLRGASRPAPRPRRPANRRGCRSTSCC